MPDASNLLYVFRRESAADPSQPAALVQDVRATLRAWTTPAGRRAIILVETPEQVLATLCWSEDDQPAALMDVQQRCGQSRIAWSTQQEAASGAVAG